MRADLPRGAENAVWNSIMFYKHSSNMTLFNSIFLPFVPACMESFKFSVTGKTFPKYQTKIIK
jgi:hypothetical protein